MSTLAAAGETMPEQAAAFIEAFCVDCHVGSAAEADLDFQSLTVEDTSRDAGPWRTIVQRVRDHEMPPKDSHQPSTEERLAFTAGIEALLHAASCGDGISPARAITRRLNRDEYGNTLRDLLGIHVNVALTLPDDGAGGEGFDNAAETLFLSTIHGEKYLEAANAALAHAFKDQRARRRLRVDAEDGTSPEAAMKSSLEAFLPRAFRRPVDEQELENYLSIFRRHFQETADFTDAQQLALATVLVSPNFLFRVELPNEQPDPVALTPHELASRLAYFLWASMPDDELLQLANNGQLNNPDVLAQQVTRMLGGNEVGRENNKVRGFAQSFIEQWLGTRALGREFKPDPRVAPRDEAELEGGLKYEPVLFFEDILINNLSILNLIDATFTYANRDLAKHYNIKGEFREQPRRVELPEGSHRGGVLGMGAILAISSHSHRTSPVLRGKWILETLLGTPPPPPPPNVPKLAESGEEITATSLRERLEAHRQDPACAACHDRIDPLGFGLENFDVLGRWRSHDEEHRIDARGRLPDGTEFEGPDGLRAVLMARRDQFARHLTTKIMGFALGRGLTDDDYCSVDAIVDALKQHDYSSHTLIQGIVSSPAFRFKAGTNPRAAVPGSRSPQSSTSQEPTP